MLDAVLSDGDLREVTHAIQNALRPPSTSTTQRLVSASVHKADTSDDMMQEGEVLPDDFQPEAEVAVEVPNTSSRPKATRKPRTPKVVEFDFDGPPSFVSFAQTKGPQSDQMRFLVAAAWFKERGLDAITADHVYTCYRLAGWPSGIADFSAPLRNLKRDRLLDQRDKGTYAINHVGLSKVDALGTK